MYEEIKVIIEDDPLSKEFFKRAIEKKIGASYYFLRSSKGGFASLHQNCLSCYEKRGFKYNQEVVEEILNNEQRVGKEGDKKFSEFLLEACNKCFELKAQSPLVERLSRNLKLKSS